MGHPPETSLTSRELAKRLLDEVASVAEDGLGLHAASAIIDAWVRVREAESILAELDWIDSQINYKEDFPAIFIQGRSNYHRKALATARKQLEEIK